MRRQIKELNEFSFLRVDVIGITASKSPVNVLNTIYFTLTLQAE